MDLSFASDFYLLDFCSPITLRTSNRIAGQPDQPISRAQNHHIDITDPDQAGGNVVEGDRLFVWPLRETPVQPPLGSQIIDSDGVIWTILALIKKTDPLWVWDAQARDLAMFYSLDNEATVYEATYTQAPSGEAIATYAPILINGNATIPARFQPVTQDAQILEDAEWPRTEFAVVLGVDIFSPDIPVEPASSDFRLVDSTGKHYRIISYRRAERIDALPVAVCVLVIEGAEGNAQDRITSSGS